MLFPPCFRAKMYQFCLSVAVILYRHQSYFFVLDFSMLKILRLLSTLKKMAFLVLVAWEKETEHRVGSVAGAVCNLRPPACTAYIVATKQGTLWSA